MPFGRHRGCLITELPDGYLWWLCSIDLESSALHCAVHAEAARRRGDTAAGVRPPCPHGDPIDRAIAIEIIEAGRRAIVRRVHPDIGGSHEAMIAAMRAADWLLAVARTLGAERVA
jgi:hypothetical protein